MPFLLFEVFREAEGISPHAFEAYSLDHTVPQKHRPGIKQETWQCPCAMPL